MPELDTLEDTLFVPMLGRIYASENFPNILKDGKALELRDRLPGNIKGKDTQTQYTLLAGAVRSANMDRRIRDFLARRRDGVVVLFGCGLETTPQRNEDMETEWYCLDLPDVIEYRRTLLPEGENERYIPGDAFDLGWLDVVRSEYPDAPILVVVSGVFHYFPREKVVGLLRDMTDHGDIEVVFDAFSSSALKRVHRYMKQVGHEDARMHFCVDDAAGFVDEVGGASELVLDEKYYSRVDRKGMGLSTRVTMWGADLMSMIKTIQISLQ